MNDFKGRTLRGGLAKLGAKAADFVLRMGSLIVLARMLDPTDFGLVGMVTAITGVLGLFKEFGLSLATVQRESITEEQLSTLFWINMLVGTVLGLVSAAIAPLVASFYNEPRLVEVMAALGLSFVFNAGGVQHSALLQRQMRFTALAVIEILALVVGSAISILMALAGSGYWSLVAWSISLPLVATVLTWIWSGWIPGRPRFSNALGSLMRFGGIVTLNSLVVYIAYNLDKILLGRFWGAQVVGIYGRAYQLVNLPTDYINSATGSVAIPALSRLQSEPERLRVYFLKGYSLVLSVTIPTTFACALFSTELIHLLFGPKWSEAARIFLLLAPTIFVFALINPAGWLLVALGLVGRSLRVALVLAPVVIVGCVIGLPYGAAGVALGFSSAMILWAIPHLLWCFHGTVVSFKDVMTVVGRPLLSGVVASVVAKVVLQLAGPFTSAFVTLLTGGTVLVGVYLLFLLFVMKQKDFYLSVFRSLRGSS